MQRRVPKKHAKKINKKKNRSGFTLLELLIVIAILAVLMTMVVITLNPAETLKKARDTQRITDLSTLKTAIGLYVAETSSPVMGTATTIYLSAPTATPITGVPSDVSFIAYHQPTSVNMRNIDASGWIPIHFDTMSIGSPISSLPVDPTNTTSAVPTDSDLCYRYVTDSSNNFELAAVFESVYYKTTINLAGTDGGVLNTAPNLVYEVGSKFIVTDATNGFAGH